MERILALLFTCIVVGHCQGMCGIIGYVRDNSYQCLCETILWISFSFYVVSVYPDGIVVVAVGGTTTLGCFSSISRVESIRWLANGSVLASSSNVQQMLTLQTGLLTITNLTLDYNMTNFSCLVYYSDRQPLQSNDATLLLVQGLCII